MVAASRLYVAPGPPARPLPRTKFVTVSSEEYSPAPLDETSLWNGVLKFAHPQQLMPSKFTPYAIAVLDHFYPLLASSSTCASNQEIEAKIRDPDHASKISGYPCSELGYPSKLRALEAYGIDGLARMYDCATPVIGATLKDELRPTGKDARFFRPQDVSSYAEGIRLFEHQNEYIAGNLFAHPSFFKFCTPGTDLSFMYKRLFEHRGDLYDADGASWDANFPLAIAEILCYWRSREHEAPDRVRRYYEAMYNGYTAVGGHLFHLVGQPSGHVLTTTDNCLANIVLMSYHAWRNKLPLEEFLNGVLFYCCGDDLVWSDRTKLFYPEALSESYHELGVYLEFSSLEPVSRFDLTFVSTHPRVVKINGVPFLSYVYDAHRLKSKGSSFKSREPKQILAKIASYCQLSFFDEDLYRYFRDFLLRMHADYVSRSLVAFNDPDVVGAIRATNPEFLRRLYLHLE